MAPRATPDLSTRESPAEFPGGAMHGFGVAATKAYIDLTGVHPDAAEIYSDAAFDRHVVASILAVAVSEGGSLSAQSGLSEAELAEVVARFFPGGVLPLQSPGAGTDGVDADEMEVVRELLGQHCSSDGDCGRWLVAMLARRAQEPNHLWEDLGLRERSELTRLMDRHFAPLAVRNDKNMRWKRFIYRVMCEDDGFVMCSTPVCGNCADYALCFGAEDGESRVASPSGAATKLQR